MSRAKGCNPCPADAKGTHGFEEMLGAAPSSIVLPKTLDLTSIALAGRDQGNDGTCVGFGSSHAVTSCARQRLGSAFGAVSALASYVQSRAISGTLHDPVDGSTCAAACMGFERGGFMYERDYPYVSALKNTGFRLGASQTALRRAGVKTHRLVWTTEDDLWLQVRQLLAAGKGVFGGWVVGDAFEAWKPSDGPWDGTPGPNAGGHCMPVHDYPLGLPRLNNSWGLGVGDGGFWTLTPRALARASSLWAIDLVPMA